MPASNILYKINNKFTSLLDIIYPVGSVYMSIESTSPAELFGGTWTQIEGSVLAASGTFPGESATPISYAAAGSYGGSANLSISQMPSHNHTGSTTNDGTGAHTHTLDNGKFRFMSTTLNPNTQEYYGKYQYVDTQEYIFKISQSDSFWAYTETDSNGSHVHTFATTYTGEGAHYYPLHYSVNVWRRTA